MNYSKIVGGGGGGYNVGADCYCDGKIAVVLIQKCATQSIKAVLEKDFERKKLEVWDGVEYAAMIRNPVERWISGIATHFANRINNGISTFELVEEFLNDKDGVDYLFKTVSFEEHTKPQHLFIEQVKDRVNLFPLDYSEKFYDWIRSNGYDVCNAHIHNTLHFDKNSYHYKIFEKIKSLMTSENTDKINKFFKTDMELYLKTRGKYG